MPTLSDIIGQPITEHLMRYVRNPYPCCFLLCGSPGTGKSYTANALANDLGCPDDMHGFLQVCSSDMTVEGIDSVFRSLRFRPLMGNDWKVLLIEELDGVTSKQAERLLKVKLDPQNLPAKTTIIATSNDPMNIPLAIRNRFRFVNYSSGPEFRKACLDSLAQRWYNDTGDHKLPLSFNDWGYCDDENFSMRTACDEYIQCLEMWKETNHVSA